MTPQIHLVTPCGASTPMLGAVRLGEGLDVSLTLWFFTSCVDISHRWPSYHQCRFQWSQAVAKLQLKLSSAKRLVWNSAHNHQPDGIHIQDKQILTQARVRWSITHGPITFIDQACPCVVKHASVNIWSRHADCFSGQVPTVSWCFGLQLVLVHVDLIIKTINLKIKHLL